MTASQSVSSTEVYLAGRVRALQTRPMALYYLDWVRGLAAMMVMIGHLRALFFVDYGRVAERTVLVRGFYFLTGFGNQAVIVFFVLSGMFVSLSLWRAYVEQRWSWGWYLTQRLTRLWIVLIPALVLGACWDQLGMRLFGVDHIYGGLDPYILNYPVAPRSSLLILLGNILFVQTILVEPFGSNGPLWSLANEFWYYMMFPCLVLAVLGTSLTRRLAAALALLIMLLFVGWGIGLSFGIWLLGAAVVLVPSFPLRGRMIRLGVLAVTGIVFLGTLAWSRLQSGAGPLLPGWLLGLTFALFAYVLCSLTADTGGRRREAPIAGFSYTLYLTHMPFLAFLAAWSYDTFGTKWQPDPFHLGLGVALGLLAIAYAWLVAYFTEAQTDQVRKRITRSLRPADRYGAGTA